MLSDCHGAQADGGILAQRGDGFQRHIAGTLDGPFVVLLEQDGTDQAIDSLLVVEDADHIGATLNLAVEPLEGFVECSLTRCAAEKSM